MNQLLINTVEGNQNFVWEFALTDSSGAPVDLTNSTISFHAQLASNVDAWYSAPMVIISPLLGTCSYNVRPDDFDVPGIFNCQIEVKFLNGTKIISFDGIQVNVAPSIPIPDYA
jgi:hypothetical protein